MLQHIESVNLTEGVDYMLITPSNEGKPKERKEFETQVLDNVCTKFNGFINKAIKAGTKPNIYVFTPEAFFDLIISAKNLKKQRVNPRVYRNYFKFLQKVYFYYSEYQKALEKKKLIGAKLGKAIVSHRCGSLEEEVYALREEQRQRDEAQRQRDEAQYQRMEQVLDRTMDIQEELHDTKNTLESTKSTLTVVANHLTEKSLLSTKNPQDKKLVHHVLVMTKVNGNKHVFRIVSGQSKHVDNEKERLLAAGYTVVSDKFYQANGVDFRNNVQRYVQECIDERMEEINSVIKSRREDLKMEIDASNNELAIAVKKFNKRLDLRVAGYTATHMHGLTFQNLDVFTNSGKRFGRYRDYSKERRYFSEEVKGVEYVLAKAPIVVGRIAIKWIPNEFISLEDIVDMIHQVNKYTQCSPVTVSFEE